MGKETYLGDGVYASHDGYQIWLRTGDGNNQRIALEPSVFASLVAYERFERSRARVPLHDEAGTDTGVGDAARDRAWAPGLGGGSDGT